MSDDNVLELATRLKALERKQAKMEKLERGGGQAEALAKVLSTYTLMHGARRLFLWNLQSEAASTVLVDALYQSGGGILAAGTPSRAVEDWLTHGVFDGVDDHWWEGASGTKNHYYGSLAVVAWVRFASGSLGNTATVISRWRTATANRSFFVRKNTSDVLQFSVSGDGTAEVSVTSSLTVVADQWYFVAGRHTASSELALWVSNPTTKELVQDVNTTSIPANSFPTGAAEFNVGARNSGAGVHTDYLTGDMALLWTGAYATPDAQIANAFRVARPLLGY